MSPAAGGVVGVVGGPGGNNMSPQLPRRSWGSRESYTSDGDSGVGAESTTSRSVPVFSFMRYLALSNNELEFALDIP